MKHAIGAVVAAVSLLVLGAAPVVANEDDVIRRGSCSERSDWKLKLSPENGRIEVEFEVDQNQSGHEWRIALRHDGEVIFRGTRTTAGPSGSFEVRRVTHNHAGTDQVTARARNPRTDEVCRGAASF